MSIRRAITATLSVILTFLVTSISTSYAQTTDSILSPGQAAVTAFSGVIHQESGINIDPDGPSLRVINLPTSGAFGLVKATKTFTVTASQIGQVFGITVDDQPQPDIFVAATAAYGIAIYRPSVGRLKHGAPGAQFMSGQFGPVDQHGGPDSIWRINGKTGEVTLFANVRNNETKNIPAALGGLAFDAKSQQLFVADRATGFIHRFTTDGVDQGVFDHGVDGLAAVGQPAVSFDPSHVVDIQSPGFHTEDPTTWGFAPEPRRVYALAVYQDRLFYSVARSQIWSVGIAADGSFANDARMEIEVADVSTESEISSITFDDKGWMYIAERGAPTGDYNFLAVASEGKNRVKRFAPQTPTESSPSYWVEPGDEYSIGMPANYQNADGGVALDCAKKVWATGERLLDPGNDTANSFPHIDGLQGTDAKLVKPANTPPKQSWYINYYDYDADAASRGHMGAMVILKVCKSFVTPLPTTTIEGGVVCPAGTILMGETCVLPPICPKGTFFENGHCIFEGCPWGSVLINKRCVRPPQECPPSRVFIDGRCVPIGCPPQLVLINGYCRCPKNFEYRHGRCVPPVCPPGKIYRNGICVPPICPRGEKLVNGRCIPPICPPGKVLRNGICVPPICPRGEKLVNGRCIPPVCPPGKIYRNGICVPPICPRGEKLVNGRCVPPICPPGKVLRNGICVPPICPRGEKLVNGRCIPPICPPGKVLRNGICVPPICPRGEKLVNGRCVPPMCPPGKILRNGICVPPVICDRGEKFVNGRCVKPICPPGKIFRNGICVPRVVAPLPPIKPLCPAGQVYRGGKCIGRKVLTQCPAGQVLRNGRCVAKSGVQRPSIQTQPSMQPIPNIQYRPTLNNPNP